MGLERGEGPTQWNGFLGRQNPQYELNSTKEGEESYLTTIQVVMPPPNMKKYKIPKEKYLKKVLLQEQKH